MDFGSPVFGTDDQLTVCLLVWEIVSNCGNLSGCQSLCPRSDWRSQVKPDEGCSRVAAREPVSQCVPRAGGPTDTGLRISQKYLNLLPGAQRAFSLPRLRTLPRS